MRTRFSRRRGAAAVELAVSMIFLVPLIMYMFFLQDMLVMKLNGQEAAVQATWDFAVLNYGAQVRDANGDMGAWGVSRRSRWTYCDHTSAYDSYDQNYDCNDQIHHKAMSAHECWIGNDGSYSGQVYCVFEGEPLSPSGQGASAVANFGQGGTVRCYSRLGIMNYYLPNSFLNNFRGGQGFSVNVDSKGVKKLRMDSRWAVGSSGTAKAQDDAHNDRERGGAGGQGVNKGSGETSAGANYWRLARTEHVMLVDPWALTLEGGQNEVSNIDPDASPPSGHPLYARISAAYDTKNQAIMQAKSWNQDIQSDGLLNGNSMNDFMGDDLSTAAAAYKQKSAEQNFNSHYAGQWSDPRVQSTNQARQGGYFGLSQ